MTFDIPERAKIEMRVRIPEAAMRDMIVNGDTLGFEMTPFGGPVCLDCDTEITDSTCRCRWRDCACGSFARAWYQFWGTKK